jgi:hypothetical protein
MARITKKEKQRMIQIVLALIATALLWTPIDNFISSIFGVGNLRLFVGIGFLIALALIGKLKI